MKAQRLDQLDRQANLAGWPTCTEGDAANARNRTAQRTDVESKHHDGATLVDAADLAGWPSPMAGTPATAAYNEAGNTDSSRATVDLLSGWPTPGAESGDGGSQTDPQTALERMESGRRNLDDAVTLAGWTTPRALDGDFNETPEHWAERNATKKAENPNLGAVHLPLPTMALMASGPTSPSSPAETASSGASRGSLNPAFSGWLMGFPLTWLLCGLKSLAAFRSRTRKSPAASDCSGATETP